MTSNNHFKLAPQTGKAPGQNGRSFLLVPIQAELQKRGSTYFETPKTQTNTQKNPDPRRPKVPLRTHQPCPGAACLAWGPESASPAPGTCDPERRKGNLFERRHSGVGTLKTYQVHIGILASAINICCYPGKIGGLSPWC